MNHDPHHGPDGRDAFSRRQTAHLLRAARAGHGEAVEWAFAALPESRYALRLRVAHLVAADEHDTADAAIARGLRLHPHDTTLRLLSAQSLERRGLLREADRAVRRVLVARPRHVGALLLGGRIARAEHDWPRAIDLLRRAVEERPERDDIRGTLCAAMLDGGCIDHAVRELGTMHEPSPVLCGRVLAAQDRVADAIEWLDEAWRKPCFADERDEILVQLIDLLEGNGQYPRLERLLEDVPAPGPALSIRAARSWLQLGAYRRAILISASLRAHPSHRTTALSTIVVAAAMLDRGRLAARTFIRLQGIRNGTDAIAMADLWRRALFARTFRGRDLASTRTEQKPGLLRSMLDTAATVLRDAARGAHPLPDGLAPAEIGRSRAICLAAAGHAHEAAAALEAAGAIEAAPEPTTAPPPPIALVPVEDAASSSGRRAA